MNLALAQLNTGGRNTRRKTIRRGFSMMLVLISLGMATILTTAYVTSQDSSATIGENVANAAAARWSAVSGLELGVAALETDTDWRTAHNNGVLIDNYSFGGGTLDVLVEDVETSAPPTAETTAVRITCIATKNGVTQVTSAMAQIDNRPGTGGVAVDLSEFVVFTAATAVFKDSATITRWPTAPMSMMGERVNIGTQQIGANGVNFVNSAAAIDATVYYRTGASASLVANEASPALKMTGLLDQIPLPAAPIPPTVAVPTLGVLITDSAVTLDADTMYHRMEITGSAGRLNLNGDITVLFDNDLRLKVDSGIYVNGNVTIVIADQLSIDQDAFIELQPDSTLTIYVDGGITIDDGYVGAVRADQTVRDTTGDLPYMDPQRIRIFTPTSGVTANVTGQSVLNASIYGSRLTLNLADTSAIYGRVAARFLNVSNSATIFYDSALNSGGGYTDDDSALFDSDGRINANVRSLASLDTAALQTLSDALATPISFLFGILTPVGGSGGGTMSIGPTDPTPRTVEVVLKSGYDGQDYKAWEANSDGAVVLVRSEEDEKIAINSKSPGAISMTP